MFKNGSGSSGGSSPRRSSVPDSLRSGAAFLSSDIAEEPQVIKPSEPNNSDVAALVVDDDEMPRRITPRLLLKGGFAAVFVVSSGAAAIKCFKQHPEIGFVTMDYNMPGMNGMHTILELKKIAAENGRELRVVGVTSEEDPAIKTSMITAGAEKIFAKPSEYVALGAFARDNFPREVAPRHNSIP